MFIFKLLAVKSIKNTWSMFEDKFIYNDKMPDVELPERELWELGAKVIIKESLKAMGEEAGIFAEAVIRIVKANRPIQRQSAAVSDLVDKISQDIIELYKITAKDSSVVESVYDDKVPVKIGNFAAMDEFKEALISGLTNCIEQLAQGNDFVSLFGIIEDNTQEELKPRVESLLGNADRLINQSQKTRTDVGSFSGWKSVEPIFGPLRLGDREQATVASDDEVVGEKDADVGVEKADDRKDSAQAGDANVEQPVATLNANGRQETSPPGDNGKTQTPATYFTFGQPQRVEAAKTVQVKKDPSAFGAAFKKS